jgi:hypothetical protein
MLSAIYSECLYAECRYTECRSGECRGTDETTRHAFKYSSGCQCYQGTLNEREVSVQLTSLY